MHPVLAMTAHTGLRLAEIGYLLLLFAGAWLIVASVPRFRYGATRSVVAGAALAGSGVLLIIATHWGHYR